MIKKLLRSVASQRNTERRADLYRNLIRHEARIGGTVFGPVAPNVRREFFCLDERTWVWHEEWIDNAGQSHIQTTRYDVRPDGILKAQNGKYLKVNAAEARRFKKAVHKYRDAVQNEMYSYVA